MIKRVVFVTGKDGQQFTTAVNAMLIDIADKRHAVVDVKFNSTCEQGQTEYSALILVDVPSLPSHARRR